jgi:hypothetical protein
MTLAGTKRSSSVHVEQALSRQDADAEKPWQALAKYPKVFLYAVLINIGPLLFGYDMVIIGAVSSLRQFKMDFGEPHGEKWVIQPFGLHSGTVSFNLVLVLALYQRVFVRIVLADEPLCSWEVCLVVLERLCRSPRACLIPCLTAASLS